MRTIAASGGVFDRPTFAKAYETFMTTPGSHNDTYASTCHRMFFANRMKGLPLDKCPDNDNHNVDTIDGLVLPCVVALSIISAPPKEADTAIVECVRTTRNSPELERYATILSASLRDVVKGSSLPDAMQAAASRVGLRGNVRSAAGSPDPMTS